MTRLFIPLMIAFMLLPVGVARAADVPEEAASAELAGDTSRFAEPARRAEREKRFIRHTLDSLGDERTFLEEEIDQLEKEWDAITPLESPQRGMDIQALLDWFYRYHDWLGYQATGFEADLEQISPATPGGWWVDSYGTMAKTEEQFAGELKKMVGGFRKEEKRLAGILDRTRLLQVRYADLREQLAWIEHELADRERPPSDRERARAERLRLDAQLVHAELLSLPPVDEDILMHYAVMIEQGEWEQDWISHREGEYEVMGDTAAFISGDAGRFAAACQRATRFYEGEIRQLNSRLDEIDRSRSRVSPAGTIRGMDRSRELNDFYERLKWRYSDRIGQLRTLVGAYEAELAEALSTQGE